jgi:hypothetical protein
LLYRGINAKQRELPFDEQTSRDLEQHLNLVEMLDSFFRTFPRLLEGRDTRRAINAKEVQEILQLHPFTARVALEIIASGCTCEFGLPTHVGELRKEDGIFKISILKFLSAKEVCITVWHELIHAHLGLKAGDHKCNKEIEKVIDDLAKKMAAEETLTLSQLLRALRHNEIALQMLRMLPETNP